MTIYELDEILALLDWEKICEVLEAHGFRKAGEVGKWEFKPRVLHEQSAYCESAIGKDIAARLEYYGTLFKDNKVYEGRSFISLTLFEVFCQSGKNLSVPRRSLLFTDAPCDPEYIRAMNSPYKCDKCGEEYIKSELYEYDDKFLCFKCLAK